MDKFLFYIGAFVFSLAYGFETHSFPHMLMMIGGITMATEICIGFARAISFKRT